MTLIYIPVTAADIMQIHDRLEATSPGLKGIADPGKVDGIAGRIETLAAYDQLPDLLSVAAAYLCAVARAHAFNDANKRTAFLTMALFLSRNRMPLKPSSALEEITVKAATGEYSIEDVAEALKPLIEDTNA